MEADVESGRVYAHWGIVAQNVTIITSDVVL